MISLQMSDFQNDFQGYNITIFGIKLYILANRLIYIKTGGQKDGWKDRQMDTRYKENRNRYMDRWMDSYLCRYLVGWIDR